MTAKLPPAPPPTSPTTRLAMQANRSRDTSVELAIRRALHARGLRYRTHRRPIGGLRCEVDVLFPRERVVVLIHGCWWHGCPEHWAAPKANREWWTRKVAINIDRDRRHEVALVEAGWHVVQVWEHEDPEAAADRIEAVVLTRRR